MTDEFVEVQDRETQTKTWHAKERVSIVVVEEDEPSAEGEVSGENMEARMVEEGTAEAAPARMKMVNINKDLEDVGNVKTPEDARMQNILKENREEVRKTSCTTQVFHSTDLSYVEILCSVKL